MIDKQLRDQWTQFLRVELMRNLDKSDTAAKVAAIGLALLTDLEDVERFLARNDGNGQ